MTKGSAVAWREVRSHDDWESPAFGFDTPIRNTICTTLTHAGVDPNNLRPGDTVVFVLTALSSLGDGRNEKVHDKHVASLATSAADAPATTEG